jgi:Fur family transcriptional regulator, ferric uptake regulator
MSNKKLLQKRGVKITDARLEILDLLSTSSHPLSYENIKDSLSMDKATFYRNITKFEELDIINSIESHDKKRYFEIKNKPHAHFTCRLCNRVECIQNGIYISLPKYDIENVIVQGICPECKLTDRLP